MQQQCTHIVAVREKLTKMPMSQDEGANVTLSTQHLRLKSNYKRKETIILTACAVTTVACLNREQDCIH